MHFELKVSCLWPSTPTIHLDPARYGLVARVENIYARPGLIICHALRLIMEADLVVLPLVPGHADLRMRGCVMPCLQRPAGAGPAEQSAADYELQ